MTSRMNHSRIFGVAGALSVGVLLAAQACAADAARNGGVVTPLMTKDLAGVPGKEVLMLTVGYLAGGASMPHRHDANVFVYVLEGSIITQVEGQKPVTLTVGQSFYENPNDIHVQSANASATQPAKFLVFMVKDKDKPASRPVDGAARP